MVLFLKNNDDTLTYPLLYFLLVFFVRLMRRYRQERRKGHPAVQGCAYIHVEACLLVRVPCGLIGRSVRRRESIVGGFLGWAVRVRGF